MGYLNWVDMLAPPFNISFKGNENLKTNGGALLTMMYGACFIFACVIFIRDYFDTSKPSVSISEEVLPEDLKLNMAENGLLPIFTVWHYSGNRFLTAKETYPKFSFLAGVADLSLESGKTNGISAQLTRFLAVPCSELQREGKFNYPALYSNYEQVKADINRRAMCFDIPDTNELFINGTGFQHNDRTLLIRVSVCYNREDCEWINHKDYEINAIYPQFKNVFKDKEKPFQLTVNMDDYIRFYDWKMFFSVTVKTQSKIIYDTQRVYGDDTVAGESSFITEVVKEKDTRDLDSNGDYGLWDCQYDFNMPFMWCKDLIIIQYKLSTIQLKYTRAYTTLVGVMSEIGGISSIIMAVFTYLNAFFLNFSRKKLLVSTIFPVLKHVDKSKGEKYRDELYDQAVEVVDSYFDIANIFQDLACLRLLVNLLVEENQQNLATIYPLYSLHIKKNKEKESKQKEKIERKETLKKQQTMKKMGKFKRSTSGLSDASVNAKKKKNLSKPIFQQLSSYLLLTAKAKTKADTVPEENIEAGTISTNNFEQLLHRYIDRSVDKMLIEGMTCLAINPPKDLHSQLSVNATEQLQNLHMQTALQEAGGQVPKNAQESSIKGLRRFFPGNTLDPAIFIEQEALSLESRRSNPVQLEIKDL